MSTRISVVMAVYNGEKYLREAIESILGQGFGDFEFIIIDDGSEDMSHSIIESYTDRRIKLLKQDNSGLAYSLHRGILEAESDYIVRMDADDIAYSHRIESQFKHFVRDEGYVAMGSWADIIAEDGTYIFTRKTMTDADKISRYLLKKLQSGSPDTPFLHSSVIMRKKAYILAGGYPSFMKRAQDVVLFNRLIKYGRLDNLSEPLIKYRIVPNSISNKKMNKQVLAGILVKAINGDPVTESEIELLKNSLHKNDLEDRFYNYLIYLTRKILIEQGDKKLANSYLERISKLKKNNKEYFTLRVLSNMPQGIISLLKRIR